MHARLCLTAKPSVPGLKINQVQQTIIEVTITKPKDYGGDRTLNYSLEWRLQGQSLLQGRNAVPDISARQTLNVLPNHVYDVTAFVSNDWATESFTKGGINTLEASMLNFLLSSIGPAHLK